MINGRQNQEKLQYVQSKRVNRIGSIRFWIGDCKA